MLINISRGTSKIPTGLITTGPNIASQTLLFEQLSERLRTEINGPVVILRSSDSLNLKALLKQVIRDAIHQVHSNEAMTTFNVDDTPASQKAHDDMMLLNNRRLLNYDLEILQRYIKSHGCQKAVIALQDSEAFDPSLLGDMITLFR